MSQRLSKKTVAEEKGNTIALNKKYFSAICKFHKLKCSTSQFNELLGNLKRVPVKEKTRIINLLKKMKPREQTLK